MNFRYWIAGALTAVCLAVSANAQFVNQVVNSIVGTTCTNQFVRTISTTGSATCATVGTNDLNASLSLTTPILGVASATSINFGGQALNTYTATTWTPVISTDATAGTPGYTIQVGSYEQIGRQVTVRFTIALSSWGGSPTGNTTITGLPVASANTTNDRGSCSISVFSTASNTVFVSADILPNTSVIRLEYMAAAGTGTALMPASVFGAGGIAVGFCSYHT